MIDHQQFTSLLKRQAREVGSQKELAKQLGISPQYLSDVINGRKMPNERILKAMGLEFVPCYRKVYHREKLAEDGSRERHQMVAEDDRDQGTEWGKIGSRPSSKSVPVESTESVPVQRQRDREYIVDLMRNKFERSCGTKKPRSTASNLEQVVATCSKDFDLIRHQSLFRIMSSTVAVNLRREAEIERRFKNSVGTTLTKRGKGCSPKEARRSHQKGPTFADETPQRRAIGSDANDVANARPAIQIKSKWWERY